MARLEVKRQHVVAVLILAILLMAYTGTLPQLSIVSNYQGPKPRFYAIVWEGRTYTSYDCSGSLCIMDTSLEWDPDEAYSGYGNLAGEETTMFIPGRVGLADIPSWVPQEWTRGYQYYRNPIRVYEWKIEDGDGTIHYYRIEEWVLKWFITISYEWDSDAEAVRGGPFSWGDVRFHGVEVWFRIRLDPMWYFENTSNVYFGIAKIKLANIKVEGHPDPSKVRVNPMSIGSILPIYDGFRQEELHVQEAYEYRGTRLNPEVFRREVYTRIILEDFGNQLVINPSGLWVDEIHGDTVTMELDVHVFVAGEWVVKDIDEVPDEYGRQAKVETIWSNPLGGLFSLFSNPLFAAGFGLTMILILVVIVLVLLAVFAPGVLAAISSAAGRLASRKKGG